MIKSVARSPFSKSHAFGKTYSNSEILYINSSSSQDLSIESPFSKPRNQIHKSLNNIEFKDNSTEQNFEEKNNNSNLQDQPISNNNLNSDANTSPLVVSYEDSSAPVDPNIVLIDSQFNGLVHQKNFVVHPSLFFLPYLLPFLADYTEIPNENVCPIANTFDIFLPTVETAIAVSTIEILFSLLSVSDIIGLLTALLLDTQIIVFGKSLRDISFTVWGLTSLLPFPYVGTLVPLLSTIGSHLDLLQAPTPFLIGVPLCPQFEKTEFYETTIFVNLDKGVVSFQGFFSNPQIKYPNFPKVVKDIETLIKPKFLSQGHDHQFSLPQPLKAIGKSRNFSLEIIDQICSIIKAPFDHLLGDQLACFFVTDANSFNFETIFNKFQGFSNL